MPNESSVHYKPQVGHYVRVVLEGYVVSTADNGWFDLGGASDGNAIRMGAKHVTAVERLPDPEPEWRSGDFVLDAAGRIFECVRRHLGVLGWYTTGQSTCMDNYEPIRPLTLLVRDGKQVTS